MKFSYILFLLLLQLFLNPFALRAQVTPIAPLPKEISAEFCKDDEMTRLANFLEKCLSHPRAKGCKGHIDGARTKYEACTAFRGLQGLPSKEALGAVFTKIQEILAKQGEVRKNQEDLLKEFQRQINAIKRHQNRPNSPKSDNHIREEIDEIKKQNQTFREILNTLYNELQKLNKALSQERQERKNLEKYFVERLQILTKSLHGSSHHSVLAPVTQQDPPKQDLPKEAKDTAQQNSGKDPLPSLDKPSDNKLPPPSESSPLTSQGSLSGQQRSEIDPLLAQESEKQEHLAPEGEKSSTPSQLPSVVSQSPLNEKTNQAAQQEKTSLEGQKEDPPSAVKKFKGALSNALQSMPKVPQESSQSSAEDDFYKSEEERINSSKQEEPLPPLEAATNSQMQEKGQVIEKNAIQDSAQSSPSEEREKIQQAVQQAAKTEEN